MMAFFFTLDEEMLRQAAQGSKTPGMEIPMLKLHVIKLPTSTNNIAEVASGSRFTRRLVLHVKGTAGSVQFRRSSPDGTMYLSRGTFTWFANIPHGGISEKSGVQ
jgi:hypothetical protein